MSNSPYAPPASGWNPAGSTEASVPMGSVDERWQHEFRQAIVDEEHLRLLSVGYLVSGCMSALFALFGLFYIFLGVMMRGLAAAEASTGKPGQAPPPEVFWIFSIIGGFVFVVAVVLALLKFRASWCLKRRKSRGFCMFVAGVTCLGIPYGTLLGIFTFIVLGRDSVAMRYRQEG